MGPADLCSPSASALNTRDCLGKGPSSYHKGYFAGNWFCSPDCHSVAAKMRERVSSVPVYLEGEYSWQILHGKDGTHATTWALKAAQVPIILDVMELPRLQVSLHISMVGPTFWGCTTTTWDEREADVAMYLLQEILTESFDPIVELTTGADLMMAMVYSQELGDWDYTGMYTAILRHRVNFHSL